MSIAEAYTEKFSCWNPEIVYRDAFYDFLYEHDYNPGFCNIAKLRYGPRDLKEWILRIHTGESLVQITSNWSWDKREKLGQEYLKNLARDFTIWFRNKCESWQMKTYKPFHDEMMRRLEIDGYMFTSHFITS